MTAMGYFEGCKVRVVVPVDDPALKVQITKLLSGKFPGIVVEFDTHAKAEAPYPQRAFIGAGHPLSRANIHDKPTGTAKQVGGEYLLRQIEEALRGFTH